MLEHGIYLPCSQFEAAFLSEPMTQEMIRETVAAAGEVMESMMGR